MKQHLSVHSTLFAAWNAATYVAQIEDQRLAGAMSSDVYSLRPGV